jgi:hypothetical protein
LCIVPAISSSLSASNDSSSSACRREHSRTSISSPRIDYCALSFISWIYSRDFSLIISISCSLSTFT